MLYEVDFPESQLGFTVRCIKGKSIIVVADVINENIVNIVSPHDTVLSVNGNPIGPASDRAVRVSCVLVQHHRSAHQPVNSIFFSNSLDIRTADRTASAASAVDFCAL